MHATKRGRTFRPYRIIGEDSTIEKKDRYSRGDPEEEGSLPSQKELSLFRRGKKRHMTRGGGTSVRVGQKQKSESRKRAQPLLFLGEKKEEGGEGIPGGSPRSR